MAYLFSPEYREEIALKKERAQRQERQTLQARSEKLREEERELGQERADVYREKSALDRKEEELKYREQSVARRERSLAQLEARSDPTSPQALEKERSDNFYKRYFGFAPHNTTASQLLYLVIHQEHGKLAQMVKGLPKVNDFELPAYFQEGVYQKPHFPEEKYTLEKDRVDVQQLYMTALEAALWLMHLPSLEVFEENILNRLKHVKLNDQFYNKFLQDALQQIRASKERAEKLEGKLNKFTNHIRLRFTLNEPEKVEEALREVDIYLKSLGSKPGENRKKGLLDRDYWMTLPAIVRVVSTSIKGTQMGANATQHLKRVFDEMINVYLIASFYFLANWRKKRSTYFEQLNKMYRIGSSWEQYTHHPASGATFDQEGNELSGEIGQRYHDLHYDTHTGRLFNQQGEEVELVGRDLRKVVKDTATKTLDLGKKGYKGVKKAFSGPERAYFLFLNERDARGNFATGDVKLYNMAMPTKAVVKVSDVSPNGVGGTITLPGKGPRRGLRGKRGDLKVRYPALFVVPYDNNPSFRKHYLVAHSGVVSKNGKYRTSFNLTPTGEKFANDKLVKKFWKSTFTIPAKDLSSGQAWQNKLKELFNQAFKGANRHYIQDEIHSDQPVTALFAGPFSHPLDEEEPEDGGVIIHTASSSSSALEQF